MTDRILIILTKVLAIIIVIMAALITIKIYKSKYMLVRGQEKTLENSVYSSKDLEIAIQNLNVDEQTLTLLIINKGNKDLNIQLEELKINSVDIDTELSEIVKHNTTLESIVDINLSMLDNTQELQDMRIRFIVNNKHNIDLALDI